MTAQLTQQLQKMETRFAELNAYFASDGKVTPDEQQVLTDVRTKLDALRKQVAAQAAEARPAPAGNASAPPARPAPAGYLTEKGWKAVLQAHAGKVKDNGLLRALAAYEKLKAESHEQRLKALALIFKLALDASTKTADSLQDVKEYLGKVCQHSLETQEAVDKLKKAAAVPGIDKTMLRNMVVAAAKDISQSAKANTALFGVEVLKACKAFEVHAKEKLDDLEDEVTAQELLGSLVSMAIPEIGKQLAEKVVNEIGKKLVEKMADTMGEKLGSIVKSAGPDSSKKALEKAVGTMVVAAGNAQGAILKVVTGNLIPLCDRVIAEVNAGKELSPQLTAFIEPFILEQTGKLDAMMEARFGIPSPAKSRQTQIKVFKNLVRVFQEKVIIAQTPSGVKMEWNVTGIPDQVRKSAEATAQKAGQQLEREMDQAPVAP